MQPLGRQRGHNHEFSILDSLVDFRADGFSMMESQLAVIAPSLVASFSSIFIAIGAYVTDSRLSHPTTVLCLAFGAFIACNECFSLAQSRVGCPVESDLVFNIVDELVTLALS